MTAGTCYTGIGGFDCGLRLAGFDIAWQAEADPDLRGHLAAHWPASRQHASAQDAVSDETVPVDLVYAELPTSDTWATEAAPAVALALRLGAWLLVEGSPRPWEDMRSAALGLLGAGWHVSYRVVRYATSQGADRARMRQRVWMLGSRDGNPAAVCAAMGLHRETPLGPCLAGAHRTVTEWPEAPIAVSEVARLFPAGWTAGLPEAVARRGLSEAASPMLGAVFAEALEAVCAPAA